MSSQSDSPIARLRQQTVADERVALLEQAPLFSVLRPHDLRDLVSKFYSVRYQRGEALFREGEPAERLFLTSRGWGEALRVVSCNSSSPGSSSISSTTGS